MDIAALNELARDIFNQVGLGPAEGPFSPQIAWVAHRRANARQNAPTVLKALLDIEERFGPGSVQEAVVQMVINCGPVPLESYPITLATWEALGFEIYQNGDGSHGAHIPMHLRVALPS